MSKYTTELRYICESCAGLTESVGERSVNEVVEKAIPHIFNFDFPIFDETYRKLLETKIIKHFYTREIGLETYGLWKLKLDTKLNEIMPYFNQRYKSTLLEFNPFYDVDLSTEHKLNKTEEMKQVGSANTEAKLNETNSSDTTLHNTTGSTSEETVSATKNKYDKYSDTPQGALTNIQNDTYLTNARLINDTDAQTGKTTVTGNDDGRSNSTGTVESDNSIDVSNSKNVNVNSIDDYLQKVKGKSGGASYSELLNQYRNTFLNIDMEVIESLNELFFNLW